MNADLILLMKNHRSRFESQRQRTIHDLAPAQPEGKQGFFSGIMIDPGLKRFLSGSQMLFVQ